MDIRKNLGWLFSIILLVALGVGGLHQASATTDSWSQKDSGLIQFTGAITANTLALVTTAVLGKAHNIRSLVITNTASGYVRFYDSSTAVGTGLIGTFGVIANTPLVLTEDQLGVGMITGKGKALYCDATTGTVHVMARDRLDSQSPR